VLDPMYMTSPLVTKLQSTQAALVEAASFAWIG